MHEQTPVGPTSQAVKATFQHVGPTFQSVGTRSGKPVPRKRAAYDCAGLRVHLIGVGGSGMSGAAALLLDLGASVSGTDLAPFNGMGELVQAGARVAIGHHEAQLDAHAELVVYSAAIPDSNPELTAARARGLCVIKYAEFIGALMSAHDKGVAIAGTHGKSTTTAMCVHLFRRAGFDPSFLVGARSRQLGGSSGTGAGPHFIVESCEFDRSFLHLTPESATILNLEPDHLDCYDNLEAIVTAFARFAGNVDSGGLLVCNGDDPRAKAAVESATAEVQMFGFSDGVDWRACNLRSHLGCYAFDVEFSRTPLFSTRLSIPGRYNVANALAAIALAHHAGADVQMLAEALPTFAGIHRRMDWRGEGRGVTIIDDYAHHPTEIRVTIEAARSRYSPKRTWVVFQPHQSARTRHFMEEFAESFGEADEIIVPDVYDARGAGDGTELNGSAELVARIRRTGRHVHHVPCLSAVADHILEHLVEGDLVLTMGAGDIWKVADELVARICQPDRV